MLRSEDLACRHHGSAGVRLASDAHQGLLCSFGSPDPCLLHVIAQRGNVWECSCWPPLQSCFHLTGSSSNAGHSSPQAPKAMSGRSHTFLFSQSMSVKQSATISAARTRCYSKKSSSASLKKPVGRAAVKALPSSGAASSLTLKAAPKVVAGDPPCPPACPPSE